MDLFGDVLPTEKATRITVHINRIANVVFLHNNRRHGGQTRRCFNKVILSDHYFGKIKNPVLPCTRFFYVIYLMKNESEAESKHTCHSRPPLKLNELDFHQLSYHVDLVVIV